MTENATNDGIDMALVRAEVAAEVRARRASGVYPAGFERDLDALFDRFAPRPVTDNLEDALERSEDAAGIDPEIPLASNNAAFGAVKKVMAKLLGWYHQFLVQQIMGLGVAINNVLRTLVEKVTHLETLVGDDRIRAELDRLEPDLDDDLWRAAVIDAARGITGRVALADAGVGGLLAEVSAVGVDVYGVEPRPELADTARARGLDVRNNDIRTHLDAVAGGELSGLVLRGCVERLSRPALLELLERAAHGACTGGSPRRGEPDAGRVEPRAFRRRSRPHARPTAACGDVGVAPGRTRVRRHQRDHGRRTGSADTDRRRRPRHGDPQREPRAPLRHAVRTGGIRRRGDALGVTAIHQFVPTLAPRDAVSIHYLAVQRALLDAGYRSEIYAYEAKEELRKQARPYREFTGGSEAEPTWIMYHSSVGSPVADFVAERQEPLIIDYHNITPASFFQAWEPSVVGVLNLGRRQLARLAPCATLGLADSTFNAQELARLGTPTTHVVPIMLDIASLDRTPDPEVVARIEKARASGGSDWLFVGRIAPNKAQHDIVKAFAAYRRFHDPDARLHLVGGSTSHLYETTLHKFIEALDLADAVDITGPVSAAAFERVLRIVRRVRRLQRPRGFPRAPPRIDASPSAGRGLRVQCDPGNPRRRGSVARYQGSGHRRRRRRPRAHGLHIARRDAASRRRTARVLRCRPLATEAPRRARTHRRRAVSSQAQTVGPVRGATKHGDRGPEVVAA